MKRLISCAVAATLAFTSLAASAKVDCPELSASQVKVLNKTWKYGEERIGKGWGAKMSALAYQESKLGKDTHGRGSYGVFQMQPATVAYMNNHKNTHGIKVRLQNEFEYSAQEAHKYLAYWKAKGYSDSTMYMRYNGGYSNSHRSKRYSASVQRHVQNFNQCFVYTNGEIHERATGKRPV